MQTPRRDEPVFEQVPSWQMAAGVALLLLALWHLANALEAMGW